MKIVPEFIRKSEASISIVGGRLLKNQVTMNRQEEKLYPEIEDQLKNYLKSKYQRCEVKTTHSSAHLNLEVVLRNFNIDPTTAIGLKIKIDILGILSRNEQHSLVFVEVKDKELTLKDLGQLWGYSQLMDPTESFLVSSKGLGGLSKLFNVLKREDLLKYGQNRNKYMQLTRWNTDRKSIDYSTLIPKI